VESIWNDLVSGNITIITGIIWYCVAFVAGAIGGAIGGILVGGEHLGKELAAMMGGFFGPIAAAPGVLLGLIALNFI